MKVKLQQREKKTNKDREINMLLNMLVTTMSDLIRQIVLYPVTFISFSPTLRSHRVLQQTVETYLSQIPVCGPKCLHRKRQWWVLEDPKYEEPAD